MASRASTPRSRSRSSTGSSGTSDTTMPDAPPLTPVRPRPASHINDSATDPPPKPPTTGLPPTDPAFSLLLSLPRELRDRIYTCALVSPYPFWYPAPSSPGHNVALALLHTCKQIHSEATPILYASNKFLFTHPSDLNIFRVIASPYSSHITSVYLRIRERDVKLWTSYLGSKSVERSMKADLPRLKQLWIFLRCGTMGTPGMIGQLGAGGLGGGGGGGIAGLAAQVQAVQNVLGGNLVGVLQQQVQHQIAALQQQVQLIGQQQHGGNPPGNGNGAGNVVQGAQLPAPMPFLQFAQGGYQHQHPPQPHPHGLQNNPPNPSPLAQHMAHTLQTTTETQTQTQPQQPQQHQIPPPPPPPPPPIPQLHPLPQTQPTQSLPNLHPPAPIPQPHAHPHPPPHPHPHTFYASFLRWEREMGLETLCLSLAETRPADADVKIVCIMKLPRHEVGRLLRVYPDELMVDRMGDARTRFRRVHGVEVSLEVSGYDVPG